MQAAAPALLVTGGSFVEGSDVVVWWHTGSLPDDPATEDATARPACCPQSSDARRVVVFRRRIRNGRPARYARSWSGL
jgi:hypothetical protein